MAVVKPKKATFLDNIMGGLYGLENRDGNYYADSIIRQNQIDNALKDNETFTNFLNMDSKGQGEYLKANNYKDIGALQEGLLGQDKLNEIDAEIPGIREGLSDIGAWEKGANRDMSKQILHDWIGEHKLKTLGYGLGGTMNLAGLTDNDKFGGQIGGAALGAGLGSLGFLPGGIGAVPAAMFGGAIGSLFDKLRAKREQEAQYPQYYGR